MMKQNPFFRTMPIAFIAILLATACLPEELPRFVALGGPRVWLDQPLDGASIPLGVFTLKAHARDTTGGVRQIAFVVNGTPLGSVTTDPSADLAYAETAWNASVPGEYVIQAVAVNAGGEQTTSSPARVCVGGGCPDASPAVPAPRTATATPTATPQTGCRGTPVINAFSATPTSIAAGGAVTLSWNVSNADIVELSTAGRVGASGSMTVTIRESTAFTLLAMCGGKENMLERTVSVTVANTPAPTPTRTATPQATATRTRTLTPIPPTPTRTNTPPQQTGCSGTPSIASFGASPTSITAGQSATLSWGDVSNADSAEITPGIGGVPAPGSTTVTPTGTTTYTLIARCGQNSATRTVTVTVSQPQQDTTPPTISSIAWNPKAVNYPQGCSPNSFTVSATVTDSSGVSSVMLNYRYLNTGGSPVSGYLSPRTMSPTGGGNYTVTVNTGNEPAQYLGGTYGKIEFYIRAGDSAGNAGNSGTHTIDVQFCPS